LLGADSLEHYNKRGLTAKQWMGWQIYCRHYSTPTQRSDINTALIRHSCGQWGTQKPKLPSLLIKYGKQGKAPTEKELQDKAKKWAESFRRGN
jgi:hypothetical protein